MASHVGSCAHDLGGHWLLARLFLRDAPGGRISNRGLLVGDGRGAMRLCMVSVRLHGVVLQHNRCRGGQLLEALVRAHVTQRLPPSHPQQPPRNSRLFPKEKRERAHVRFCCPLVRISPSQKGKVGAMASHRDWSVALPAEKGLFQHLPSACLRTPRCFCVEREGRG